MKSEVRVKDGEIWQWKRIQTSQGTSIQEQMYNHGGLLVETDGHEPVFFIGDSFSPSGIDDYCLMNQNLMREDSGYFSLL